MTTAQTSISDTLDWLPPRTAPAEQLNTAHAHALAAAVPLINGTWTARSNAGVVPALLLNLDPRPDVRGWLSRTTRRADTTAIAELYLLDAPAGALMLLLVQADDLPVFWCAFNLAADNERAMVAVLLRERRVGLSDGPLDRGGNGIGGLVPIEQITLPGGGRLRALMPETMPGNDSPAVTIPPLVARAITVPDVQPPARVAFVETPRVRLVAYATPRLMGVAQSFLAGDGTADNKTRPTYHTISSEARGSMEESRLGSGWRCVRMVNLRHIGIGAATITTEIIVAYRGEPRQCWSTLAEALRTAKRSIPPTTLIYAWFLARTAALNDTDRLGWLPVCEALMAALPDLPGSLGFDQLTPLVTIGLAARAAGVWSDPKAAKAAARQALAAGEEQQRAIALVTAAGRWDSPPPTPHPSNADLHIAQIAAIAAWQHLARSSDEFPLSPAARTWIGDPLRYVWRSWPEHASTAPTAEARRIAREAAASLRREVDPKWIGGFGTNVPASYTALRALGVAEVWLDAAPDIAVGWVRLVPHDGRGGLVIPWVPAVEPPACWRLVLRWDAALELNLLLLAVLRDVCREGVDRVLVRAPHEAADHPLDLQSGQGPQQRQRGRRTVELPRGRTQVIRPGATPRPPQIRGQYVADEERQEIDRQVAELHGVRAHFMHFQPESNRQARAEVRALWAQLSDAEKLLHFRTTELPANATVRGLKKLDDGRWSFRYQRGQYDPERAPRRIVAQGALLVAGALKLIREAQDDRNTNT